MTKMPTGLLHEGTPDIGLETHGAHEAIPHPPADLSAIIAKAPPLTPGLRKRRIPYALRPMQNTPGDFLCRGSLLPEDEVW